MHWTYDSADSLASDQNLCQGDILRPDEGLRALFEKVHPYFSDPKYQRFLVLTQSCDLVQRDGRCKATHICLSVIRSLEDLIASSLRNQFGYLGPGIFKKEIKERALMLIERVINQNEQNLGLFYLHPDADAGISVRCVAVLRVSISVKANEHYRTLIAARVGRLQQAFQHRLGWMVGNLYSRVDVRDWKEDTEGKEEEELIQEIFRFNRMEPLWVASKTIRDALKRNTGFFDLPAQDQEKLLEECSPMPPKEAIIGRIGDILKECYPALQEEDVERIKKRLNNDDRFGAQIRRLSKP